MFFALAGFTFATVLFALVHVEILRRLLQLLDLHSVAAAIDMLRPALGLRRSDPDSLRARATRRIRRRRMTFSAGRTYAMDTFVVWFARTDFDALEAAAPVELLQEELRVAYAAEVRRQGWIVRAPATVRLHAHPTLRPGAIDIEARIAYPANRDTAEHDLPAVPPRTTKAYDGHEGEPPRRLQDLIRTEDFRPDPCSATITYRGVAATIFADDDAVVLGRTESSPLAFQEPGVSREHAVLDHLDGAWLLRPSTAARNGTSVDGIRIVQPLRLTGRRIVGLGHEATVEFVSSCRHRTTKMRSAS